MLVFPKEVLFSMNIIRRSVTLYNLPLTHYPTPHTFNSSIQKI